MTVPRVMRLGLCVAVLCLDGAALTAPVSDGANAPPWPAGRSQNGLARAAPARPTTHVLLYPIQDASVDQGAPDANFGAGDLHIGARKAGDLYRLFTYLQFDVSSIPPGADIAYATLQHYQQSASGPASYWVWSWTAAGAWDENTITWNSQPWGAYPQGSTTELTLTAGAWFEWDVSAIVENWIVGGNPAYGIMLAGDNTTVADHVFGSGAGKSAKLVIEYYAADTATPTATATRTNTPTATRTSTPTATGTSTRTPTATPTATEAPARADLLVTDLWPDGSSIAYQLLNASDTPAAAGHQTGLWVDGVKIGDQREGQALAGWERRVNHFAWTCSPPADTIQVCANIAWEVPESDYQNNCRAETWSCDKAAPRFVAGPAAADIAAASASICWTTDEPVTGTVRYDQQGLALGQSAAAPGLAAQHCVPLTKLAAGAAYHYVVEAADAAGNRVTSRDLAFTTLSQGDSQAPQVTLTLDAQLAGRVLLRPAATDDRRVARVTFLVDGQPVGADFSAPFVWEVDTTALADGDHTFTAQAEDAAGNQASAAVSRRALNHLPQELSPIQVNILAPVPGQVVGRPIRFELEATHRFGLPIRQLVFMIDDRVVGARQYTCNATTPARPIARCTGDVPLRETWTYDGSGLPAGSTHRLRVAAFDYLDPSNRGEAAVQFTIAQPTDLVASRQVVRDGAFFRVTLRLENHGLLATEAISITDASLGYQPVDQVWAAIGAGLPTAPAAATLGGNNDGSSAELSYAYPGVLNPGQALTLVYNVVPVLLEAPTAPHIIGSELRLSYRQAGVARTQRWTDLAYRSSAEFAAALAASDYLIVSRPAYRMALAFAAPAHEFALRGAVADLARLRGGVLGYLSLFTDNAVQVKSLLTSPGGWGARLRSAWTREGYLLLVGEDESPVYHWPTGLSWWKDGTTGHGGNVDTTDNWYADTIGNDHRPELRVGRIVGQSTLELTHTIRNILNVIKEVPGHSFDRSDALALAGPDSTWDNHAVRILAVASVLRNSVPPSTVDAFLEEYFDTAVGLRRNALAILGSPVEASLTLDWDTAGIPAGDYVAGVKLTDAEGIVVATGTAGFRLGGRPGASRVYLPVALK